jgi:hypothetical protein
MKLTLRSTSRAIREKNADNSVCFAVRMFVNFSISAIVIFHYFVAPVIKGLIDEAAIKRKGTISPRYPVAYRAGMCMARQSVTATFKAAGQRTGSGKLSYRIVEVVPVVGRCKSAIARRTALVFLLISDMIFAEHTASTRLTKIITL